ncbi:hypothetical protein PG989_001193 [Apiospora arundinis]
MGSPEWSTPELSTRMRDLAASPFKALNSLTRCFRPLVTMSPSLHETGSGAGLSVARRNHLASKPASQNQHRKGCSRAGADALLEQFRGGEQPIQNLILAPVDLVLRTVGRRMPLSQNPRQNTVLPLFTVTSIYWHVPFAATRCAASAPATAGPTISRPRHRRARICTRTCVCAQKYSEAEEMHRQTLALMKTVLGREHPSTLASRNNLALVLENQGKYSEAEEIHRQTLALKETVLGREHPETVRSRNNLAKVLRNMEMHGEVDRTS